MVFDEKATQGFWFILPVQKYRFETAMVLEREVVDAPYANENAKRIAVIKEVLAKFTFDSEQVTADKKTPPLLSGDVPYRITSGPLRK